MGWIQVGGGEEGRECCQGTFGGFSKLQNDNIHILPIVLSIQELLERTGTFTSSRYFNIYHLTHCRKIKAKSEPRKHLLFYFLVSLTQTLNPLLGYSILRFCENYFILFSEGREGTF